ncbi:MULTISPECIES: hypothetical protein [unclassified Streptomyces]|uniref:hypothetical protein n=1 Tax=unclassified Streptomyces TaxID=2593676 RepID=UPI003316F7BA
MSANEYPAGMLHGRYRDVLFDPAGRVVWDHGWRNNTIVGDCRRLLATMLRGTPGSSGLLGLRVGAGLSTWDGTGPPPAGAAQTALVDPHPYTVPTANLRMDFLDTATVSATPTNRLQIQATLGPSVPNWPDANHISGNLREFGLIASLDGTTVLVNYVTHPVIAKDPASTLQRTVWLTF